MRVTDPSEMDVAAAVLFVFAVGIATGGVLATSVSPEYHASVVGDSGVGGPVGDVEAWKMQGGNVFVFVSVDEYVTGVESDASRPMVLYMGDLGKPDASMILLPVDGPGTYSVTVSTENRTREIRVRVRRSWSFDLGRAANR